MLSQTTTQFRRQPRASAARRSGRGWPLAAMVVVCALAAVSPAVALGRPQGTKHPAVGKKLAQLELQGLTGDAKDVKLADLAGKVVLINFWGTWCPPCVEDFPHIAEIGSKYADRDNFRLFAISSGEDFDADVKELRTETEAFLKDHKSDLPTYADVKDRTRSGLDRVAGFRGYPTTIILDGEGTIRGIWENYTKGAELEVAALVEELLNK